ncbi:hypothetical protein WN943_027413 [Citrus x changshan-huyou]
MRRNSMSGNLALSSEVMVDDFQMKLNYLENRGDISLLLVFSDLSRVRQFAVFSWRRNWIAGYSNRKSGFAWLGHCPQPISPSEAVFDRNCFSKSLSILIISLLIDLFNFKSNKFTMSSSRSVRRKGKEPVQHTNRSRQAGGTSNKSNFEATHFQNHKHLAKRFHQQFMTCEENVYPDLVKVFYSNMDCSAEKENRVITTVGGVSIEFDDSELNFVLGTSDDGLEIFSPRKRLDIDDYVHIDAVKNICHRIDLSDDDCTIHFRTQCLCLQTRILLLFIQSIVLPRSGHLDEVSHMDVALIDCILRHRPVDLGYTIVRNMLSIPKLITRSLPYGHFITRILKYFSVHIQEPSCRPSKSIGDEAVSSLGFECCNGTWTSAHAASAPALPHPEPPTSEEVTLQQLMDGVRTLSVRQTEFDQQQQQLIHGQRLLFEHFGIPYPYPPSSPPSSPPQ